MGEQQEPGLQESISSTSLADEMEAINRQIEWHTLQISLLKIKRNSLAPISKLPNELLCQIFSVYATDFKELSSLKWTRLMLVCRRWHDLAITHQYLWSFIEMYSTRDCHGLETQLQRSGAAPLTIRLIYLTSPTFSSLVLGHAARIVHLDVAGHAAVVLELLGMLPSHPLPLLRTLKLKPDYKREDIPEGTVSNFADTIFDTSPALTSLALSYIDIRWSLLRGLESLALTHCGETVTSLIPSFGELLSTLKALPALKNLRLDNVLAWKDPELVYDAVALPRLTSLYLRDDIQSSTDLLAHLAIPPTASIVLYPTGLVAGRDATQILVLLRRHLRSPSAPPPQLLHIDCPPGDNHAASIPNFMIDTFSSPRCPNVFEDVPSFGINSHPANEHALRQIMTKVMKTIPCESITHLDARAAGHLTVASWKTALSLLPSLGTLYIHLNNAATNLALALLEMEESAKYPPRRLRRIQLVVYNYWYREDEPDRVTPVRDGLERLLQAWHRAGAPLEILEVDERFGSLTVDETVWETFSGLVKTLIRHRELHRRLDGV
ncbi:hypothetical protein DFH06DRAFT_461181 [Mycena polygramma]|nr:hypothetical protein DFH06DRAFT_461181 [Mycena polygramma]